jgi:hypothetical protein
MAENKKPGSRSQVQGSVPLLHARASGLIHEETSLNKHNITR